jgi:hypothetical protein
MFGPSNSVPPKCNSTRRGRRGRRVLKLASEHNVTDLVLLSHGWNNDMADAKLYAKLPHPCGR